MFIIVVLLLLIGWGITVAVTWPGFRPHRINVVGTSRVDPNLVRSAAHIPMDGNMWLLNPWATTARIDAIPYVLSVSIQRSLPNRITLDVRERHPESCVVWHGGSVTIDASQRILENGCHMGLSYLLPQIKSVHVGSTVTDPALARLSADVATVSAQHFSIKSASFDQDGGLVLLMRDGTLLLLGEDSALAQTSALLGPIFAGVEKQGRKVSQVDLRAPSTPVVRYKESSNQTEKSHGGA